MMTKFPKKKGTTISKYEEVETNRYPQRDLYYSIWKKIDFPKHLITVVVKEGNIYSVEGFVKHDI